MDRVVSTPRPVPSRVLPLAAAGTVIALALPVFLIAGWPVAGWASAPSSGSGASCSGRCWRA